MGHTEKSKGFRSGLLEGQSSLLMKFTALRGLTVEFSLFFIIDPSALKLCMLI